MSDLTPWAATPRDAVRRERDISAAIMPVYREARIAASKVDGLAAVSAHTMQRLAALDAERQAVAAQAPELAKALAGIEFDFLAKSREIIGGMYQNRWSF